MQMRGTSTRCEPLSKTRSFRMLSSELRMAELALKISSTNATDACVQPPPQPSAGAVLYELRFGQPLLRGGYVAGGGIHRYEARQLVRPCLKAMLQAAADVGTWGTRDGG